MRLPYAEVIGDPIVQSKSPTIHGFWLRALGIDADYRAAHVLRDELADYLAQRREDRDWRGCNVTMPHKQAVMAGLDAVDPLAARVGAVNTVVPDGDGRLTGYNTDVAGFLEPLGADLPARAIVVGAGGAARAVLCALASRGIGGVTVMNRDVAKAAALLGELGIPGEAVALGTEVAPAALLVNTSSLGMAGHPPLPPVELAVSDDGTVYDIVTHPLDTELLRRARGRGLRTVDGLAMLIGQAAAAFERFYGAAPPRERDGALRDRLLERA